MNLIKQNQAIPAALISNAAEFFKAENEIKCLINGRVLSYSEIPQSIKNIVKKDMLSNIDAMTDMRSAGIKDEEAQLKYYIGELYGAFDNQPDICALGVLQSHEYVYTRKRKLKRTMELEHGKLTEREIEVLTEVGLGKLDKEICATLNIKNDTLRNHKDNISRKAGMERKNELAVLAFALNLVDLQ